MALAARRRELTIPAALDYARRGLPVFPTWPAVPLRDGSGYVCGCGRLKCDSPAKHPMPRLAPHGLKDATTNAETIVHWWEGAPNANIAIALNADHLVLDIDPRHDGDRTLARLEQEHGPLPKTWRANTGSGGTHIYFGTAGADIHNSVGLLGPGLDVRAHGGYVISPPSIHVSGKLYDWELHPSDTALAPLPPWLIASITNSRNTVTTTATWRGLVRAGVENGRRNTTIARLAGHLLRRRVDPVITLEFMSVWNAARCRPPLTEAEVINIVNNICGCEIRRREGLP